MRQLLELKTTIMTRAFHANYEINKLLSDSLVVHVDRKMLTNWTILSLKKYQRMPNSRKMKLKIQQKASTKWHRPTY